MTALLLQILVAFIFGCAGEIRLLRTPQDSAGRQGSSLTLPCLGRSTSATAELSCAWTKNGQFVFVGKGRLKQFYEWTGIESEGDCGVRMRNLSSSHVGSWQCTMIDVNADDDRTSSQPAQVRLLVAPTSPIIEDSGGEPLADLEVLEGHPYRLHCFSRHGSPAASLSWTVGTVDITSNATSYNESEPHHEGSYTAGSVLSLEVSRDLDGEKLRCTSRHPAKEGVVESAVLIITVHYPPSNMTEFSEVNVTVALQDSFQLRCPLTSKPDPTYAWFHRNVILAENGVTEPEDDGGGSAPLWSLVGRGRDLVIDNVSQNNAGEYHCSATYAYTRGEALSTAYSAIYTLKVPMFQEESLTREQVTSMTSCRRDPAAFGIAVAMAAFGGIFFTAECALLIHVRCRKDPATKTTARGFLQELYFTRGRKMAAVHAHSAPASDRGKGWGLHISAAFISTLLMILDVMVMVAAAMAIYQCIDPSSCDCTLPSPAVLLALASGALVAFIQFVLLLSFCIRKRAEQRFTRAATKSSNGAKVANAPSSSTTDAQMANDQVFQATEKVKLEDGNGNQEKEDVLPANRSDNYKV